MIPPTSITAWSEFAPWAELRQIEQDLIISRVMVELFSDTFLQGELRMRGGTALNKLHLPKPIRYSEDIDLVRTSHGPIKPILSRIRHLIEPWLGKATFDQSPIAPKLRFRAVPEGDAGQAEIRVKLEINTAETFAVAG